MYQADQGINLSKRRRWAAFLFVVLLAVLGVFYLFQNRQDGGSPKSGLPEVGQPGRSAATSQVTPAQPWQPPAIIYNREPAHQSFAEFNRSYTSTQGRFVILVRVYSSELQPIFGATVALFRSLDAINGTFADCLAASATGENGACQIELNSPLVLGYLAVSKLGFAASQSAIVFEEPGFLKRDFALETASAFVRGRVTDFQGSPIIGATVGNTMMVQFLEDLTRASRVTAITDSQGGYQIGPLPAGNALLGASAEGYITASTKVLNLELGGVRSNVDFRLQQSEVTPIEVRVLNSSGHPVHGATISTSAGRAAPSGSDGVVRLQIKSDDASDPFQCRVTAEGYKTRFTAIDPQRANSVVVLENANNLSGVVTSSDGLPLAGAKIKITGPGSGQESTKTDADGAFALAIAVSPGYATISHAGYADRSVDYDVYAAPQYIRVTLAPSGGIYGRAVDESGRPVWKYQVTIRDLENKAPGQLPRFFSSFDGDFAWTDLPAGKFSLHFRSMGSAESWPLSGKIDAVEIRPGSIFGPVTVVLTAPGR
jgi:hypothetical protein